MSLFLRDLHSPISSRNWRLCLRLHEQIFQLEENVQRQRSESLKVGIVIYSHKFLLCREVFRQLCSSAYRKYSMFCLSEYLCCLFFFCLCFHFCWRVECAEIPKYVHKHCVKFLKLLSTSDILFKCLYIVFCDVLACRGVRGRLFTMLTATFD